ncbi:3-ketoacyl-CoA synthase 11 [Canna indica]|uniref:3-ketoacyl-CoA synthase 11 n=1 Tax=Canna indica TaxID=4628 RepID=A0AAQ3PYE3_9LILI|nr:3-ketoacyl-CoA synthase 11 [Canna indica]
MVVNHYKLRGEHHQLQPRRNGLRHRSHLHQPREAIASGAHELLASMVSMENITLNWYMGNIRSMLISNCIFRVSGATIMLTNRHSRRCRSMYQLIHTVRTNRGTDEFAYGCVF